MPHVALSRPAARSRRRSVACPERPDARPGSVAHERRDARSRARTRQQRDVEPATLRGTQCPTSTAAPPEAAAPRRRPGRSRRRRPGRARRGPRSRVRAATSSAIAGISRVAEAHRVDERDGPRASAAGRDPRSALCRPRAGGADPGRRSSLGHGTSSARRCRCCRPAAGACCCWPCMPGRAAAACRCRRPARPAGSADPEGLWRKASVGSVGVHGVPDDCRRRGRRSSRVADGDGGDAPRRPRVRRTFGAGGSAIGRLCCRRLGREGSRSARSWPRGWRADLCRTCGAGGEQVVNAAQGPTQRPVAQVAVGRVSAMDLTRPDGTPLRVLVVDDEANIAELLSMALRYEGWEVRSGAHGLEGGRRRQGLPARRRGARHDAAGLRRARGAAPDARPPSPTSRWSSSPRATPSRTGSPA